MRDSSRFQVYPSVGPGGFIAAGLIFLSGIVLYSSGSSGWGTLLVIISVGALIGSIIKASEKSKEAENLTRSLESTVSYAESLEQELPSLLEDTAKLLKKAEDEYKNNAFAPFWDAIDQAAMKLILFNIDIENLSSRTQEYYKLLEKKRHNFPTSCVKEANLPSPNSMLTEFQRLVRMGQTNYEFANIWEHRKMGRIGGVTREALVTSALEIPKRGTP